MSSKPLTVIDDYPQDLNVCAGVAVDGPTASVWCMAADLATEPRYTTGIDTALCESFDDLLIMVVQAIGCIPASMVFAVPGIIGDEIVKIRGFEHWGEIDTSMLRLRTGIKVRLEQLSTARAIGAGRVEILFQAGTFGSETRPGQRLYVDWSAGIASVLEVQREGGLYYVPSNSGCATWVPETDLERRYWKYLRARSTTPHITVNDAAGGSHGFENAWNFMLSDCWRMSSMYRPGWRPREALRQDVIASMRTGRGIGSALDAAAATGDLFARRIVSLVARILGRHLRTLVVAGSVSDGVYLTGGVAAGPYFASLYMQCPGVLDGMYGQGATFEPQFADVRVKYADNETNQDLEVRGASVLALRLAAEPNS